MAQPWRETETDQEWERVTTERSRTRTVERFYDPALYAEPPRLWKVREAFDNGVEFIGHLWGHLVVPLARVTWCGALRPLAARLGLCAVTTFSVTAWAVFAASRWMEKALGGGPGLAPLRLETAYRRVMQLPAPDVKQLTAGDDGEDYDDDDDGDEADHGPQRASTHQQALQKRRLGA